MISTEAAMIRAFAREVAAIVFVGVVLVVWIGSVTPYFVVQLGGVQQAFVDTFFFIFAMAGGYIVFGKKAIDDAIDTYKSIKQ